MADDAVRIDRWLVAARCFKTRPLAQEACDGGHVKVNERPAQPARPVKVGDTVEARTPGGLRVLKVLALDVKRGPASVARALYEDHSPPPPPREAGPMALRDRGEGRPTKRDARDIRRLKGDEEW